jgi:LuxR family maltose regulon positive regulatory protein
MLLADLHNGVEELILEALLQNAKHAEAQAVAKFEEALALAEPVDMIQPFVGFKQRLTRFLYAFSKTENYGPFVHKILAANESSSKGRGAEDARFGLREKPLTLREQDTLDLLARRYHNDEIAAELGISVETVKTHLHGVYNKLGVHNRRHAVMLGQALGLLASPVQVPMYLQQSHR